MMVHVIVMFFEYILVEPCFPSSGVASLRPRLGGEPPWFTIFISHLQDPFGWAWNLVVFLCLSMCIGDEDILVVIELWLWENFILWCTFKCSSIVVLLYLIDKEIGRTSMLSEKQFHCIMILIFSLPFCVLWECYGR